MTLFGIDIFVKLKQLKNALFPILFTPSGIIILVNFSHPSKAPFPIAVTLSIIVKFPTFPAGQHTRVSNFLSNNTPSLDVYDSLLESTVISVKLLHSANAPSPIFVTPSGIFIFVKLTQL